jgi:uncharacterized protein (DUF2252 family)
MVDQLNGSNSFGTERSAADGRFRIALNPHDLALLDMNENSTASVTNSAVASDNALRWRPKKVIRIFQGFHLLMNGDLYQARIYSCPGPS